MKISDFPFFLFVVGPFRGSIVLNSLSCSALIDVTLVVVVARLCGVTDGADGMIARVCVPLLVLVALVLVVTAYWVVADGVVALQLVSMLLGVVVFLLLVLGVMVLSLLCLNRVGW